MLLSKLKVIIQKYKVLILFFKCLEKWSGCIQRFDYRLFNSSNSIILWSCILYKHSFIFLMFLVHVDCVIRYSFLLYLQKCLILKNIRTIYPFTVRKDWFYTTGKRYKIRYKLQLFWKNTIILFAAKTVLCEDCIEKI
jgi:hypothetical protein